MKENVDKLDTATLKKLMKMDGGGDDISEEEIENCKKNLDYDYIKKTLNSIDNNPNKNNNNIIKDKSNEISSQNTQNPSGMPNFNDMKKIVQQMGMDKGGMDFSKLMNNPDIMKMMGNMGAGGGAGSPANMNNIPMMSTINNIIWVFSWIQKIISFIFSIKGLAFIGLLYWYFYHYKSQIKAVNNAHYDDYILDNQVNDEYIDDEL